MPNGIYETLESLFFKPPRVLGFGIVFSRLAHAGSARELKLSAVVHLEKT